MGQLKESQGLFHSAERDYLKALNIYRQRQNNIQEIKVLQSLGAIYIEIKDHTKALPYLARAKDLSEKKNDYRLVDILGLLAIANSLNYEFEQAFALTKKCFEHSQVSENNQLAARAHAYLGEIYFQRQDYVKAASEFNKSLKLNGENDWDKRWFLTKLGLCKEQIGKYSKEIEQSASDEAVALLKEALYLSNKLGDHYYQKICLEGLGRTYYDLSVLYTQQAREKSLEHESVVSQLK